MSAETVQNTTQNAPEPVQKDKEINFEKIRKQLDQERAEKQQMQKRIEELEKVASRPAAQSDDDDDRSDEPYVDHKSLNRKLSKWEQKLDEKIEKKAEEKARIMFEQERQQSYVKSNPDFQTVLTQENIENFAKSHPAIAERMLRMPDTFDRQALLYEQIKALQASKKAEPAKSIQETIDANRRSPYYQPSGVGTAPYAQVGDFSATGQKKAYEKLQELKSKLRI